MDSVRLAYLKFFTQCTLNNIWYNPSVRYSIPLDVFITGLFTKLRVSYIQLRIALHYISRLAPMIERRMNDPLVNCPRRVLMVTLILANKYMHDDRYLNSSFAKVTGLDVREITRIEREILIMLEHNLFVNDIYIQHWMDYYNYLIIHVQCNFIINI